MPAKVAPQPGELEIEEVEQIGGSGASPSTRVKTPKKPGEVTYDEMLSEMGVTSQATEELDPNRMAIDVDLLKARLHQMNRCLINPRGQFMTYWDFFTLGALFFTATITPYEVCFLWGTQSFSDPSSYLNGLFFANIIVNLIFLSDMCFQFFLPYKESVAKGGGTVKKHSLIARKYLCSWFALDFISILPVDLIMMGVDTSQMSGAGALGAIRMLRLARLIKLARILRASRIFSRWENKISISYGNQSLIKLFLGVLFMLHLFACALGIFAQMNMPPRSPELTQALDAQIAGGDPTCTGCITNEESVNHICPEFCMTPCEIDNLAVIELGPGVHAPHQVATRINLITSREAWVCRYANAGKIQAMPDKHGEVWVAAVYVALIQLGGGVGSIVPENFPEYVLFLICIFAGSVTWAGVVGTICAVLTTGDPATTEFKQNMDALNYFLADMRIIPEVRVRCREYLRNKRDLYKKKGYNDLMELLSPELKNEVVMMVSGRMLSKVWFFENLEPACLVELSSRIERAVFAPREKIEANRLHILMRGVAAKAGNILTPISAWGEDIIVNAVALRDKRMASALTYVEIASLTRDSMFEVIDKYPASSKMVQQAAMKIAMQRAIVVVSEFIKMSKGDHAMALAGAATQSPVMSAIKANSDGAKIDGTSIIPFMTGMPLREPEEVEEEEAMSPITKERRQSSESGGGGGGGGGSVDLSGVTRRLDAQESGLKSLSSKVDGMKGQLADILKAVQAMKPAE